MAAVDRGKGGRMLFVRTAEEQATRDKENAEYIDSRMRIIRSGRKETANGAVQQGQAGAGAGRD